MVDEVIKDLVKLNVIEGIFKKGLFEIPNPRLQRIREKLVECVMTVKLIPGKNHYFAEAL